MNLDALAMSRLRLSTLAGAIASVLAAALATASNSSLAQTAAPPAREPLVGDDAKDESAEDLAKQLQNPVGDLISFPIQDNVNFGYGPHNGAQNVLQMQPVVPFHIADDWNIITRTILPVVWNPDLSPIPSAPVGTGPTSFTAFLAPARDNHGFLWGAGPVIQLPTISSTTLGSSVWGAGPSAVVVYSAGPWVAGALFNDVFSLGGTRGLSGNSYNTFLANPFVAYNFDEGWYVNTGPNITANWQLPGPKWTVPIGGGGGRVFKIGALPVDLSIGAYYNVVKPGVAGRWQLNTSLTLVF